MINIAVMGYGTVGSGVVEVLIRTERASISESVMRLDIKYVLDMEGFPGSVQEKIVHDF